MKKLIKIFGIALVVALMASLCFGSVALADDPPEVTVNFNVTDPDITVTAYKAGPAGNYSWSGTAQFTLTGASSATGSVTAGFDGVFEGYSDITGQPTVYGGYTAYDGDFRSEFSAFSYMWVDYGSAGAWSTQSIDATGVTDGSMTVNGGATAVWGSGAYLGGFTESGQTFSGEAESVTVYGDKMWKPMLGGYDYDPSTWNPSTFQGAQFTATATASSTLSFTGGTEAGTYYQGWETDPWQVLDKQGLGFEVYTSGSSLDNQWVSDYAYNVINAFVDSNGAGVFGESSTALVGWTGIPGYISP